MNSLAMLRRPWRDVDSWALERVCLELMGRTFGPPGGFSVPFPGALPQAGLKRAFGAQRGGFSGLTYAGRRSGSSCSIWAAASLCSSRVSPNSGRAEGPCNLVRHVRAIATPRVNEFTRYVTTSLAGRGFVGLGTGLPRTDGADLRPSRWFLGAVSWGVAPGWFA